MGEHATMTTITDNDQHIHNKDMTETTTPAQPNSPDKEPQKKRPNACTLSVPWTRSSKA
jgi:hypothetical protein